MSLFKFWKSFFFDQFMLHLDGGGGGPTSSTVTQSNVPDWLRPQVEGMITGATKQLFNTTQVDTGEVDENGKPIYRTDITGAKPFVPYSTNARDYVAGFSPLQQQVQANAANLQVPSQFNYATGMSGAAGQGAMDSTNQAYGYGNAGFQSGQLGQQIGQMGLNAQKTGRDIGKLATGYAADAAKAGQNYATQMMTPSTVQQYMNPYQQAVTDVQVAAAQRNADIARTQRSSQAARAGAFGGARQAIENAEADRALQSQLAAIQAQGDQAAYDKAVQAMQFGSNLGLQGLQGAQQGLGTALQGGQLGLSGIGAALQGTSQGMQGAQTGLQGVSGAQAGYGLANQAAGTLGSLGTQQNQAQMGILGLQNQIGGQQQAQEQQVINQNIQNFANAQQQPLNNINMLNSIVRGYALPGTTATQYQAAPSPISQIAGLGTAGIAGLGLYNAMGGAGAAGAAAAGSDIRIKENIERIGTLANGLGVYEFDYKSEFKDHPLCGHGRFRGVMAQEVEQVMPEAVTTMDNGYKAVKYDLVEAEMV